MRMAVGLILVAVLGSCSSTEQELHDWRIPLEAYTFASRVNLADRAFEIAFESKSTKPICMAITNWPTGKGVTDMTAGGYARAVLSGKTYPANRGPRAYCSGDCNQLVKPGETITGSIPFSEFELPDGVGSEPDLRLDMHVAPYRCDS